MPYFFCFASKIVQFSRFRDKSRKNRHFKRIKMSILTQTNCISLFPDPKRPQKSNVFGDFYFFRFFQPPMSNLQKNHVKIDVFNELKYRFDPNQVHSLSLRPHNFPKKQKNSGFGTIYFWSKCLRLL